MFPRHGDTDKTKGDEGCLNITPEFLEKVKSANPIADVMGQYVELKRSGRDYVCLCPFHSERTPSCHINTIDGYFYCFGCKAGGDVITFVRKYENLGYIDAVEKLADRAGLEMPQDDRYTSDRTNRAKRDRMYQMNSDAAKFFYSQLSTPEGKECVRYLMQVRGLSVAVIKKYGIGFAPNSWSALKNHMLGLGYTENELIEGGLISRSKNNTKKSFDFFVNRAVFPFIGITGKILGFGGRTLGDDKRKYINSPDTPVYKKNNFLFSLNYAKDAASKSGKIILCEGNLDVVTLMQAGIGNAVASCGTALTPEQAKLIAAYADEAVLCYDSDQAGIKACEHAIPILTDAGLKVSVMRLKGAKDPDEFIRRYGAEVFQNAVSKAVGAVNYRLSTAKSMIDTDSDGGILKYKDEALKIISEIDSEVEREIYARKTAEELGVSYTAFAEELKKTKRRKKYSEQKMETRRAVTFQDKRDPLNPEAAAHPGEADAEEMIIAYLHKNPGYFQKIKDILPPEKFITSFNRKIYEFIFSLEGETNSAGIARMNEIFSPDEIGAAARIFERGRREGITEECADDCVKRLLNYAPKPDAASMTGDEFRDYFEKRRRKMK